MRVTLFIYLFIGAVVGIQAETDSHCIKTESVIFSCQIKDSDKIFSLCASKDISDTSGYIQYRFGRLNKVELTFPNDRLHSQKRFLYRHYFRSQVDRVEIAFVNHGEKYTIYSYYEGDGEGTPVEEKGVRVGNVDLQCKEPSKVDFTLLENSIPHDEESVLGR
jgi:hypothetical protein